MSSPFYEAREAGLPYDQYLASVIYAPRSSFCSLGGFCLVASIFTFHRLVEVTITFLNVLEQPWESHLRLSVDYEIDTDVNHRLW